MSIVETDIAVGEQAGVWWTGEGEGEGRKPPSNLCFEQERDVVLALEWVEGVYMKKDLKT